MIFLNIYLTRKKCLATQINVRRKTCRYGFPWSSLQIQRNLTWYSWIVRYLCRSSIWSVSFWLEKNGYALNSINIDHNELARNPLHTVFIKRIIKMVKLDKAINISTLHLSELGTTRDLVHWISRMGHLNYICLLFSKLFIFHHSFLAMFIIFQDLILILVNITKYFKLQLQFVFEKFWFFFCFEL